MNNPFHPYEPTDSWDLGDIVGLRYRFLFPNGYQASVVKGKHTYGGADDLWELAVMDKDDQILYDTPITDDVVGWLTPDDVVAALRRIETLPDRDTP